LRLLAWEFLHNLLDELKMGQSRDTKLASLDYLLFI